MEQQTEHIMTERTFFKTTFTFEVLSEEPIPDAMDLIGVLEEAEHGSYVGSNFVSGAVQLNGKETADALVQHGSEPGFFNLNKDGSDAE